DLPLPELLVDRWERARTLGFGAESSVYDACYVYGEVQVGEHTWVGPFTILDGTGRIMIGRECRISAGVHIYSHDTVRWALSAGACGYDYAAVQIGDCSYIGAHSVITKGVTIGDHVVIGAGSFVNRDVAPYTVAAGVPCRPIGRVVIDGENVRLQYSE